MPVNGPRFRKRDSQIPPSNRVSAGMLNVVNASGSIVGPNTEIFDVNPAVAAIREKTWDELHSGPPYLDGGPFTAIKIERPQWNVQGHGSYITNSWYNQTAGKKYRWDGGFYSPLWIPALDPNTEAVYNALGTVYNSLFPDLTSVGSGAYARLRPQLAKAGLGQAIAEMRDLPRMLSSTAKTFSNIWSTLGGAKTNWRMAPKKAANNFINHQFGWVPFLKDIHDTIGVYQNARQLKSQISRDNNRWIRRRRVDQVVESKTLLYTRTDIPGVAPNDYRTYMYEANPLYTITRIVHTDVWYEGTWKYYRPEFDWDSDKSKGVISALQREMAIYGADLNPTLVWKVTPWSWLADWFTNAGDAVQRAQDWGSDSLVSKYMYLMHHHRVTYELRSQFTTIDGTSHDYKWYRSADIKRRQSANSPFMFSLSGDLSARQIAILSALGIART